MIIQCDKCATKFRLDDSRITQNGVKVRCTKCDNVFIVTPPPPPEEVRLEELFSVAPGAEERPARPSGQPRGAASKPKEDDRHLAFDFGSEETKDEVFKTPSEPSYGLSSGDGREPAFSPGEASTEGKKFSLDDLDFSFSADRSTEDKKEEEDGWRTAGEEEEDDPFASAFDKPATDAGENADAPGGLNDGDRKELGGELDFSFGDLTADPDGTPANEPEEEKEVEAVENEAVSEPSRPIAENVIPFSAAAAYSKEGKAAPTLKAAAEEPEGKDEAFRTYLTRAEKDEDIAFDEPGDEEETEEEEQAPVTRRQSQPRMGLIIAALVIVLGGGLIYFTGVIDKLTHLLMPGPEISVVEIESIKGFYEENRNFGKLFVIDARIKNITDSPQEIKAATGVIYNDSGDKIAARSVSPGRIVSIDDVRNLQREELERAFRDPSGGVIPAKGSVPVMVLFIEVPEGLSEFGLDIVR